MDRDGEERVMAVGVIAGPEARGEVTITTSDAGGVTVHLTEVWIASGAPDVRVYLTPDAGGDVDVASAIELGKVPSFSGAMAFPGPPEEQVRNMQSLVVHCKVYSVTFGVAPLEQRAA